MLRPLLALLLTVVPMFAADPPPLPEGAVARLGVPRIDFGNAPISLHVTPDGKTVTSNDKWFDLESGRQIDSPYKPGKGEELSDILTDGRAVFRIRYSALKVYQPGAAEPQHTITVKDGYLSCGRGGKVLIHEYQVGEGENRRRVLRLAPMPEPGEEPKWKELAPTRFGVIYHPFDDGESKVIWQEPADDVAKVVVYDIATEKQTTASVALGKDDELMGAALSPDGGTLAVRTKSAMVFFDTGTGKELSRRESEGGDRSVIFTPDGKRVFVFNGANAASVLPLDPKAKVVTMSGNESSYSFALLPNDRVAICVGKGPLRIHDLKTGERLADHSPYPVWEGVRITEPGVAMSWADGLLVTWDTTTGKETSRVKLAKRDDVITLSPTGTHFLTRGDETIGLRDLKTGKMVFEGKGEQQKYCRGAFSPDGELVALLPINEPKEGPFHLDILDVKTGERKRRLAFAEDSYTFAVSPDGRTMARAAGKGVQLVELATGKERWDTATPGGADELLTDAGGKRVVAVGHLGAASITTADGTATHHPLDFQTQYTARHSALSASGRWLAVLDDFKSQTVDVESRLLVRVFDLDGEKPEREVYSAYLGVLSMTGVSLDDDGSRLVTSHTDGTCVVWHVAKWTEGKLRPKAAAKIDRRTPWERLADPDAAAAQKGIATLLANPEEAVKVFEKELKPAVAPKDGDVKRWIEELGSADFATRTAATKALAAVADHADAKLQAALKDSTNAEQLQRLESLIEKAGSVASDTARLRQVRAVEVLERIGTPEAKRLLKALAGGASGATQTREAAESLRRLNR